MVVSNTDYYFKELDKSMFTITSKQNQIRHAVQEANDKYDLSFEIEDDILCESFIDKLRGDLSAAQKVTVEKMNAQQVIFEAEQALANISASSVSCYVKTGSVPIFARGACLQVPFQ
jgi:transcription elongation GreA/GreB family factor